MKWRIENRVPYEVEEMSEAELIELERRVDRYVEPHLEFLRGRATGEDATQSEFARWQDWLRISEGIARLVREARERG